MTTHNTAILKISNKFSRLSLAAGVVVFCAAIPLFFVISASTELSAVSWARLWNQRLPELFSNTIILSLMVAFFSFVLGVSSAWFIARKDFVGKKIAIWLMLLPLTIPTYVFAHIYTNLTEAEGWIGIAWIAIFGDNIAIPDLYNIFGATFVLSLAGFSYVFLLVRSALSRSTKNLEEAARLQGASSSTIFWKINLPLLRPAIAAGLAIIILHTLSDFGAVSMLRVQTFTLSIYNQMSSRMDYHSAAALSLVLIALSLTFLILERFFRHRQRFYSGAQSHRIKPVKASTKEQFLIWSWLGLIAFFSFILPLIWLISWSWEAWQQDLIDEEFWGYAINTGIISFIAATIALIVAFPVAFYHTRHNTLLSQSYLHLSSVGFALPGPVIALGVLSFVLAQLPILYGTLAALIFAMVVRFLPLAIQAQEAALQQLTPSIEQAGRVFGAGPLENFRRVILPIVRNGMVAAWVLVFIDTLKELPATLILRPTGFDTLPVRIWIEASEEMLELAAPAALLLVIGTMPAIWIMMKAEKS